MDTILYCIWPSRKCSHCWEHLHKFLILLQYVLILETNFIIPILFFFFFPSPCSWINRRKLPLFLPLGAVCSLALSACVALCFLHISRHNYPGGVAFSRLHQLVDQHTEENIGKQFLSGSKFLQNTILVCLLPRLFS